MPHLQQLKRNYAEEFIYLTVLEKSTDLFSRIKDLSTIVFGVPFHENFEPFYKYDHRLG